MNRRSFRIKHPNKKVNDQENAAATASGLSSSSSSLGSGLPSATTVNQNLTAQFETPAHQNMQTHMDLSGCSSSQNPGGSSSSVDIRQVPVVLHHHVLLNMSSI